MTSTGGHEQEMMANEKKREAAAPKQRNFNNVLIINYIERSKFFLQSFTLECVERKGKAAYYLEGVSPFHGRKTCVSSEGRTV